MIIVKTLSTLIINLIMRFCLMFTVRTNIYFTYTSYIYNSFCMYFLDRTLDNDFVQDNIAMFSLLWWMKSKFIGFL